MFEYATRDSLTIGPTVELPSSERLKYTFASPSVNPIFSSSNISLFAIIIGVLGDIKTLWLYTLYGGVNYYKGEIC